MNVKLGGRMTIEELDELIRELEAVKNNRDYHLDLRIAAVNAITAIMKLQLEFMKHTVPHSPDTVNT